MGLPPILEKKSRLPFPKGRQPQAKEIALAKEVLQGEKVIRLGRKVEAEKIQAIFNAQSIQCFLGGMTMLETVKQKLGDIRAGLWLAEVEGKAVGAFMMAGRPQSHVAKYGEVGVLPEYRRQRIASALYLTATLQGILEGRRLFEDTIAGGNAVQFDLLPTLGIHQAGELRHRTASGRSIFLFQLSLLDGGALEKMTERVPRDFQIELLESSYTTDLWEKNMEIYEKFHPDFVPKIEAFRETIRNYSNVHIVDM